MNSTFLVSLNILTLASEQTLDEAGEELAVLELEAEGLLAQVPDGLQLLRLGSISGFQDRSEDDEIDC